MILLKARPGGMKIAPIPTRSSPTCSWSPIRPFHTHPTRLRTKPSRAAEAANSIFIRNASSLMNTQLPDSPSQRKTIYALATPPGRGGIGVIRISGPHSRDVWSRMLVTHKKRIPIELPSQTGPRTLRRCRVVHPESKEVLDDGMAVFFHGPKSYTSQDVLELHIHSGRAVTSAVLGALADIRGLRPAEPGEYTRWAFESGRIDLTEAEGIRDLVDAETDEQRKLALRSAAGETKARFNDLREQTIRCLALVEALIDFGEGEEIEEGTFELARQRAQRLRNDIATHLNDNRRGEILRTGIRLAIFGPPNAGKSSLLNYLAQKQAAIVTPLPGTTRDVLEVSLDVGGMPIIACDTAGLRDTEDVVERIGVERAHEAIRTADVALCLLPLPDLLYSDEASPGLPPDIAEHFNKDTLFLLNKRDLIGPQRQADAVLRHFSGVPNESIWKASVMTGDGMEEFMDSFVEVLKSRFHGSESTTEPLITHARHRTHLSGALLHLDSFLASGSDDVVLGAEELRYAAQEIGQVSGVIGIEDVLDSIFRDFCIGK